MAGAFDDLAKKLDPFTKKLKSVTQKSIDYKLNALKSLSQQFPLQQNELVEQVVECMSAGIESKALKDFEKNKEVKTWVISMRSTYGLILEEIKALNDFAAASLGLRKESGKLTKDIEAAVKSVKNAPEKKEMAEIKKDFDAILVVCKAAEGAEAKIPKEAKAIVAKRLDQHYADAIEKADKMPKKKAKEIPKDMTAESFAKKERELKDMERELKTFRDSIEEAWAKGDKAADKEADEVKKEVKTVRKSMEELSKKMPMQPRGSVSKEEMATYKEKRDDWEAEMKPLKKKLGELTKKVESLAEAGNRDSRNKANSVTKLVRDLEEKAKGLQSYANELQKAKKEYSTALKAASFASKFDSVAEQARKLAKSMLVEVKYQFDNIQKMPDKRMASRPQINTSDPTGQA